MFREGFGGSDFSKEDIMILITAKDLQELNRATFDAFIESGKYSLTYNEASKHFGRTQIDLMISLNIIENRSTSKCKKRYYISDLVAGLAILKNNGYETKN